MKLYAKDFLEKARLVNAGRWSSTEADGFNGAFQFWLDDKAVRCIASDGAGWEHVSVSLGNDKRCPSWSLMSKVKELFWGPDAWVVQFHPPQSEYVNNVSNCLHLWRPTEVQFPTPESVLVGIKGLQVA